MCYKKFILPGCFFISLIACNNGNTNLKNNIDTTAKQTDKRLPPVETQKPNSSYKPAFAGQTRINAVKTTTAINMAARIAVLEYKTLLVDGDPQANSTTGLGFDLHNITQSLYDCMVNQAKAKDVILKSEIPNLDIIPSHIDLVGAEIEMINYPNREMVMKNLLDPIRKDYDFIVIDCSPSLGLITVNALTASDSVAVPVQCEFFALEGLGKLLNTIKIVQSRLNPELVIEGILMTMYDGRLRLCNQVVSEVRRHFEDMVFSTIIHRNSRLAEAPSAGKPVILYDANSKGSVNYLNLAKEVLQKNDLTKIKNDERILEL